MPAGIVDDIVGASFLSGVVSNDPMDYNGHGTFVAGVIGAVGNNNVGVTGMNQAISLIACQMLDAEGSSEAPGPSGWATDAVQCIDYCIHKGAHVMSASWGSLVFSAALQV
jgi:subtilisin family serine protease